MPPRRLSESPPSAASSYEEEESGSESESEPESEPESKNANHEENGAIDKEEDDDDAEEDEEVEEEEDEKESPALKISEVPTTPQKTDPATDSDDSESTQPSPSLSAYTIKPHNRSPKSNKSGSKRPTEPDSILPPNSKKSKVAGDGEEVKKGAIQRLWSEDDEIAVLDGLAQYKSEKGIDPYSDMGDFHEFIKKSLHVDVSKNQLYDKIRRLKKKYRNNVERGENGKDPVLAREHDQKCFELSKKVWGGSSADSNDKSAKKSGGIKAANQLSLKKPIRALDVEEKGKLKSKEGKNEENMEEKIENVEEFWRKYPSLSESLETAVELSDGVKIMLREQLGMLEKVKLKQLDDGWKKLKQAELELFVQRMDLVEDQVKWALDAMKSGGS